MCCSSLWKKLVPFAIALMLGILAATLYQQFAYCSAEKTALRLREVEIQPARIKQAIRKGEGKVEVAFIPRAGTNPLQINYKPRPGYTAAARTNDVQGIVRLRVTFLESGQVGSITPLSELPHGLTEEAIKAAEKIEFQPATVDGKAVSVSKIVEYGFAIY